MLVRICVFFISILWLYSCQTIKDVTHTLSSFSSLRFKIENVTEFQLAGIPISTKQSLSDFSSFDAVKIGQEIARNKLPVSFIVNIAVKNPNTGIHGTKPIPVTLKQFEWTLFIDGVKTISGKLAKEYEFPVSQNPGLLQLEVSLDLFKFFGDRGYKGILNLALSLGGVSQNPSKITIEAIPTFSTPFGIMQAPKIRITSESFN